MGSVRVTQSPLSPPSSKPCRGHQRQQDMDYCCCAPGTASLWQFCISLPETLCTPTVPHPRQSLGGSTTSCCTSLSRKLLLGVSALQPPSRQKASPLHLPSLGKSLVLGFPPAWCPGSGWLCCPPGCYQGAIPPCQQLQKAPRGVQGDHSPAGC